MKTLKFKTIALAMALMMTMGVNAQDFHYGIKAGSNFAVQSGIAEYFNNEDIRVGLTAGLFANYDLGSNFALQAEANYNQKGAKSDDLTVRYDYVSVPVLAKYTFAKVADDKLSFNLNVGPYASYLVNAESELEDNTTDLKDGSEDLEFGAIGGFGMKYAIANNNLVFDLRLGLGFSEFDKNLGDARNKYVGLTLGYEF